LDFPEITTSDFQPLMRSRLPSPLYYDIVFTLLIGFAGISGFPRVATLLQGRMTKQTLHGYKYFDRHFLYMYIGMYSYVFYW